MKLLGLLMISGEDDILDRTLAANLEHLDGFYVLDGTADNEASEAVCRAHGCAGYTRDRDLPRPPYPDRPRDGYRQHLYEQAVADHGADNWFLLLHGDELWTFDPRPLADEIHDGWVFPLPIYFPKLGEPWDDQAHPLDQLHWHLGPGWPELRMFRGGPGVRYRHDQHFNVTPQGLHRIGQSNQTIRHYPYRAPQSQRARAANHDQTGFDPANYRHILDCDVVYWDDRLIAEKRRTRFYSELAA